MFRKLLALLLFCFYFAPYAQAENSSAVEKLLASARSQIGVTQVYDGSYRRISYPGGDVPIVMGVCTDVVIRAYRSLGIDLQRLVHEDMRSNFSLYPSKRIWGLSRPDPNIDHRRVPNLQAFFKRHGKSLPINQEAVSLEPGDLLTWNLPGNLPHIGLVSDKQSGEWGRYLVIHNIGAGTQEEDVLGKFQLTGHYRFRPWEN